MTTAVTTQSIDTQSIDAERFNHILQAQRAAYLRDGAPSLARRRSDLKKFKAALIERRKEIEDAINTDFGNRSRHETAMMEVLGVVQGIDYLDRNLRRFMRPTRRSVSMHMRMGSNHMSLAISWPITSSLYRWPQPPCVKPPRVSSSGRPGP